VNVAETSPYGALAPGWFDRAVMAVTTRLPAGWAGLRLAILLRRLVTMRQAAPAFDVERWGLRMRLHPRDNGCEKSVLFTPQMYDLKERAEIEREIAHARAEGRPFVFVDIGANVGLYSLFVAARVRTQARILAFEPEPGTFARLRFNLDANPGLPIEAYAVALADAAGEVAVELDRRDRGGTRTRKVAAIEASPVRIPCRALLSVLREAGLDRIDALKIDVEGMEDTILVPFFRDAPRSLWPALVLIEDRRVDWKDDVIRMLTADGYTISSRSRVDAMLRLTPDQGCISTGSTTSMPSQVIPQR
jgi:FkbM family methyltransferase